MAKTKRPRMCVGCRRSDERDALLRFAVCDDPPFLVPDIQRRLPGRGVSVHPTGSCLELATKRGGFARALKRSVDVDVTALRKDAILQYERRVTGLLRAAQASRKLAVGTDATRDSLMSGCSQLLIVAENAAGRRDEIFRSALSTRVSMVTWNTKEELGEILERAAVAVLSVNDVGIAREANVAIERAQSLLQKG